MIEKPEDKQYTPNTMPCSTVTDTRCHVHNVVHWHGFDYVCCSDAVLSETA